MNPFRLALALLAVCAVAIWQVTLIPESLMQMAVGPTLVPKVVVAGLTVLALVYGFRAQRGLEADESLAEDQSPLPGANTRALSLLLGLTNFWRRRVDGFEVLGEDQRRRLNVTGVPAERIALVRDGSPVTFVPDGPVEPLPADLGGKCVLLYSGNYGVAHEVETVVRGYELHHRQGSGRVYLWLSATGGGAEEVARRLGAAGLPFHRSSPVSLDKLPGLLRAPAAHLVTLRDAFVGYVMPSKIYACLESGRPLVFVGSAESDVDLLARSVPGGYWRVSCGDFNGFATALESLAEQCGVTGAEPHRAKDPAD